jgi:hypothetical protein
VSQTAVATDVYQATDVLIQLTPQIALDDLFAIDDLPDAIHLALGKVPDSRVPFDARTLDHVMGLMWANAVDAPQGDFHPLIVRDVDSGDDRHQIPLLRTLILTFAAAQADLV